MVVVVFHENAVWWWFSVTLGSVHLSCNDSVRGPVDEAARTHFINLVYSLFTVRARSIDSVVNQSGVAIIIGRLAGVDKAVITDNRHRGPSITASAYVPSVRPPPTRAPSACALFVFVF